MEEENTQGEGTLEEDLHSETFTLEEVEAIKKKMQADSERGVQKLINEKKLYQQVISESKKVAEDQSYLVSLHETNPEVAKTILETYYEGVDIDDYKRSIGYEIDYNDPKVRERELSIRAQKLADKKIIDQSKASFIERLKMTETEIAEFTEAFEERVQLKSFNVNDIEKHLEKAYKEISNVSNLAPQEAIGKSMAVGEGKSGGGSAPVNKLQNEISAFMDKYNPR